MRTLLLTLGASAISLLTIANTVALCVGEAARSYSVKVLSWWYIHESRGIQVRWGTE